MAGTVVQTTTNVGGGTNALKVNLVWTSDAAGNVSADQLIMPPGSILLVEFIPSTTAVPTNLYDVDMLNSIGVSIFDDGAGASIGANKSATVPDHKCPFINGAATTYVRSWIQGGVGNPYQLTVANAGNATSGTVNIFVSGLAV
jgi:hypothetical protein